MTLNKTINVTILNRAVPGSAGRTNIDLLSLILRALRISWSKIDPLINFWAAISSRAVAFDELRTLTSETLPQRPIASCDLRQCQPFAKSNSREEPVGIMTEENDPGECVARRAVKNLLDGCGSILPGDG